MDHRSDIFSFGAVLYEMLSGQRAFRGDSGVEILNAILQGAAAGSRTTEPALPPGLERVVRRCLEKTPRGALPLGAGPGASPGGALDGAARVPARRSRRRSGSPYPGLSPFTEADAEHFFGREAEVEALWKKLRRLKLLGMIGPSGAGKTSFLRAGLVPALSDGLERGRVHAGRCAAARAWPRRWCRELSGDTEALRQLVRLEDPDTAVSLLAPLAASATSTRFWSWTSSRSCSP